MSRNVNRNANGPIAEPHLGDPWAVVVTAICATRSNYKRAKPAIAKILKRWPTTLNLTESLGIGWFHDGTFDIAEDVELERLHGYLAPLGLGVRRANTLCRIALAHVSKTWPRRCEVDARGWPRPEMLAEMPGCGYYVADCFEYFYDAFHRTGPLWDLGHIVTKRVTPVSQDTALTAWLGTRNVRNDY